MKCSCKQQLAQLQEIASSIPYLSKKSCKISFPVIDSFTPSENDKELFPKSQTKGLNHFEDSIKTDIRMLQQHIDGQRGGSEIHSPPSTNAPYLISVWNELAMSPEPVVAVCTSFKPPPQKKIDRGYEDTPKPSGYNEASDISNSNVKVDVVCRGGTEWIRVNTIKNSRLLAEFREQDSYLTDSDSDTGSDLGVTHNSPQVLDNSLLRMGHSLLVAVTSNQLLRLGGAPITPKVTLRLTRLKVERKALQSLVETGLVFVGMEEGYTLPDNSKDNDPRIKATLHGLLQLGLNVVLGEMDFVSLSAPCTLDVQTKIVPTPTRLINLDLSAVIALISDITHTQLPSSEEGARQRFIPSDDEKGRMRARKEMREQEKIREARKDVAVKSSSEGGTNRNVSRTRHRTPEDTSTGGTSEGVHSLALAAQLIQEMKLGLLDELHQRLLDAHASLEGVEFWTTTEVRDRCFRIMEKIGGEEERRRAAALFQDGHSLREEAIGDYWLNSRYPKSYLPIIPLRLYKTDSLHPAGRSLTPAVVDDGPWSQVEKTCIRLLNACTGPTPNTVPTTALPPAEGSFEFQRAPTTTSNKRLTTHTVVSLLQGVSRRWTTLSANRASVKEIGREVTRGSVSSSWSVVHNDDGRRDLSSSGVGDEAILWIVGPRSLAEGMRGCTKLD